MWSDYGTHPPGCSCAPEVHLGADWHLQRSAPGLTGLLLLNPAHSASVGGDLWSFVAGTIDYAWCTMWIRTSESVAQIQQLFTGLRSTIDHRNAYAQSASAELGRPCYRGMVEEVDFWSFVARTINYAWCIMWI